MSRFASVEQAEEVVEAIVGLIPPKKLEVVHANAGDARTGRADGYWVKSVAFSKTVPRAWSAEVHEPYVTEHRTGTRTRPIIRKVNVEQIAFIASIDPRISVAEFNTYGLDAYDMTHAWGQIDWQVVRPAHVGSGKLAVFATNPSFVSRKWRHATAMIEGGHAQVDEEEAAALRPLVVDRYRDETSERSLRLTTEGTEYLLSVLRATKDMQLAQANLV